MPQHHPTARYALDTSTDRIVIVIVLSVDSKSWATVEQSDGEITRVPCSGLREATAADLGRERGV